MASSGPPRRPLARLSSRPPPRPTARRHRRHEAPTRRCWSSSTAPSAPTWPRSSTGGASWLTSAAGLGPRRPRPPRPGRGRRGRRPRSTSRSRPLVDQIARAPRRRRRASRLQARAPRERLAAAGAPPPRPARPRPHGQPDGRGRARPGPAALGPGRPTAAQARGCGRARTWPSPGPGRPGGARVTGASPGSIGESVATRLLSAGATVVMVTSEHLGQPVAAPCAASSAGTPAPAPSSSWCGPTWPRSPTSTAWSRGWPRRRRRPRRPAATTTARSTHPGLPQVVLPFAASAVAGDVPDTGPRNEVELRVLLLGVERLVGRLAERTGVTPGARPARGRAADVAQPRHLRRRRRLRGRQGRPRGARGAAALRAPALGSFLPGHRRRDRLGAGHRADGRQRRAGSPLVEQRLGVRTFSAAEMGDLIAASPPWPRRRVRPAAVPHRPRWPAAGRPDRGPGHHGRPRRPRHPAAQ